MSVVICHVCKAYVQIYHTLNSVNRTCCGILPHWKLIIECRHVCVFAVPDVNVGKAGKVVLEVQLTAWGVENRRIAKLLNSVAESSCALCSLTCAYAVSTCVVVLDDFPVIGNGIVKLYVAENRFYIVSLLNCFFGADSLREKLQLS